MWRTGAGIARAMITMVAGALLASGVARAAELQVVSLSPTRNGQAPAGSPILVTFDRALQTTSVTSSSFRAFGKVTGAVSGTFTFSNGNKTVMLAPSHAFTAGEVVIVNLAKTIVAADTSPLRTAGYAFQFTVETQAATRVFTEIDVMSNRTTPGAETRIYGAFAADLDHDGYMDLTTVNEVSGDLRVFMNLADGSGQFGSFLTPFPIGFEASPNETADLDNDGEIDTVVSASSSQSVWAVRGNGDGTWGAAQEVDTGGEPHGIAVLDVDGDADLDVVQANAGSDDLALLLNDGSGALGTPTYFEGGGTSEYALAAGDMDNDGITDLVVGNITSETVSVLRGNGNGTFAAPVSQDAGGRVWMASVGDVNGDGNLDVSCANSGTGTSSIVLGNGDGTLQLPDVVGTPPTIATELGDLDGDGDLDWVLASFSGGRWLVYVNDGAGNFSFDQEFLATSAASCSTLVDIDNDGDLDLALSDEIADEVRIERNGTAPSPICPPAPSACRAPTVPGKSLLKIRNTVPDTKDQLQWSWGKGEVTPKADFGDPLGTDTYALCIYDDGELAVSGTAPAGGLCAGKPCWKDKPTGYLYKDRDLSPTGTAQLKLKEGLVAGKAAIKWKAKGGALAAPDLTNPGTLRVELHRSGSADCWGATFAQPFDKNDGVSFKDKGE